MIKEAIEFISNLAKKEDQIQQIKVGDEVYFYNKKDDLFFSKKDFDEHDFQTEKHPPILYLKTLSSFVEYINENPDLIEESTFIKVYDFNHVLMYSNIIGPYKQRLTFAACEFESIGIKLNTAMSLEEMLIMFNSCFIQTPELKKIVEIISRVVSDSAIIVSDDGMTQTVETKQGVSLKKQEKLPTLISLKPRRTFYELDQPESDFFIRAKKVSSGEVFYSLHSADGGAWKYQAILAIKEYLKENLKDNSNIILA